MKKIRIPFSLAEYKKGGYEVETREGKSVRILCTDRIEDYYPLVALIKYDDAEPIYSFSQNGERIIEEETNLDLFLVKQKFEDGDIITNEKDIAIYKEKDKCYCGINEQNYLAIYTFFYYKVITRLATEEEKQRLFDALAKEGKRWNAKKKCIEDIKPECTLKPFDKVLVRGYQGDKWCNDFFGYYNEQSSYKYVCTSKRFEQCIPYNEETKYLLGTSNDCPDKYKTW